MTWITSVLGVYFTNMKMWLMFNRVFNSPPPTLFLVDWLSGRLLQWVVIQLKSSANVLLAGGDTLCMHEYITSAAVIISGKASPFGTCTLLPSWLLCSYCHYQTINWVWMWAARASTRIRCFFIYRKIIDVFQRGWVREPYMMKDLQNWNSLAKALCDSGSIIFYKYSSETQH